jgi:hypothetical protein
MDLRILNLSDTTKTSRSSLPCASQAQPRKSENKRAIESAPPPQPETRCRTRDSLKSL